MITTTVIRNHKFFIVDKQKLFFLFNQIKAADTPLRTIVRKSDVPRTSRHSSTRTELSRRNVITFEMSKILYLNDGLAGPAEKSSSLAQYQFALYTVENHETTIISSGEINEPSIRDRAEEVNDRSFPYGTRIFLFPLYIALHFLMHRAEYDVVVSNQSGLAMIPLLLLRPVIKEWVVLSADSPAGKRIRSDRSESTLTVNHLYEKLLFAAQRAGFRQCDHVILSDETDVIPEQKTTVVRGGADCGKIRRIREDMAESRDKEMAQTGDEGPVRLVYVGNLYIHRGIDILLAAVDATEEDLELVLIGPRPPYTGSKQAVVEFMDYFDKGFEEALRDIDARCDYKGVLGHEATLREVLTADIGICILPYERGLPHFKTSYPIKVFEYMAAGLPVLCTQTPAMEELLTEAQLLPSHETEEVANLIDTMASDPTLREECANRNVMIGRQHCWEFLHKELEQVFEDTCESASEM